MRNLTLWYCARCGRRFKRRRREAHGKRVYRMRVSVCPTCRADVRAIMDTPAGRMRIMREFSEGNAGDDQHADERPGRTPSAQQPAPGLRPGPGATE